VPVSRRAKIVCTLGPAVDSAHRVRELIDAGMDVARLNFSHGRHGEHARRYAWVRAAAADADRAVGLLADLQGPKIRLGRFATGPVRWETGERVVLTGARVAGSHDRVSVSYRQLPAEVHEGDRLLIDDGKVVLRVQGVSGKDIACVVEDGGEVSDGKGVSLPNLAINVPALSEKDEDDLRFALGLGADLVALSFVRSPDDIGPVHKIMDEVGVRVPVLAKIEKPEAVSRLNAVVRAFDGLMVARGDLGVELPLERVPLVQKRAVQLGREQAKPVIVATQMLDSMVENTRPTRAEASDVANAVLDGADAVMLSGETSVGAHPILTVQTMARIIASTETGEIQVPRLGHEPRTRAGAITLAAVQIARAVGARALVAFTQTGDTVRRLARLHCDLPLLAFTPAESVRHQLSLSWGVETFCLPVVAHTDDMVVQVDRALLGLGRARPGDVVVIVAGSPPGIAGSTNTVRVHVVGTLS
jgi:pyruvate kinase